MKGLCADRTQKTGPVDIPGTDGGLRWHGFAHGLFAADGRCVPLSTLSSKPTLIPHSCPIVGHTDPGFSHMCHERPVMDRRSLRRRGGDLRCVLAPLVIMAAYRLRGSRAGSLDLATFVCIVAFIKKLRASLGQAHTLSHLMRTLVQDSTIYFFIMLTFNVAMLVYAVMARASLKNFPLV